METYARVVLIHYHELGLKGHNRPAFERRLIDNIKFLTTGFPVARVGRIAGRIVIHVLDGTSQEAAMRLADFCARIPGVARTSCGFRCSRDIDTISDCAIFSLSEIGDFKTFAIRARRAHSDFEYTSAEINNIVGDRVRTAYPSARVFLDSPDTCVHIEVIEGNSYVYVATQGGIGGLPVGVSGRVMCLLSAGIDSPVAMHRMARRGAICSAVHFSGAPLVSDESSGLAQDICNVLAKTGCAERLYTVPIGTFQREISLVCPPRLRIVLYRRLMVRIACALAESIGARALVSGDSLGQVASQTLDNIICVDKAVSMPILRPLIGLDKLEIISQAKEAGTFEISSAGAPDCCTLFVPRNPETHASLDEVLAAEEPLPIDAWITQAVQDAQMIRFPASK